MSEWMPIESAPEQGVFLVWIEKTMLGSHVQIMRRRGPVSTIGALFAFDAPRATHWRPLPEPPADMHPTPAEK